MSIAAGLVGLPNVGKSTLFNALTKSSVPAENYPFCTINPHIAVTIVPDERIKGFEAVYHSEKIVPASVQFVDIAGLVKGAASGEGLGNQFLSHIREVDLIIHVLRCFEDPSITMTQVDINPLADFEIITTELMLKDIESVEKRLVKCASLIKQSQNNPVEQRQWQAEEILLKNVLKALNDGALQAVQKLLAESAVSTVPLLSAKKSLVLANVSEHEISHEAYLENPHYKKLVEKFGPERVIPVSARLEAELSQLSPEEAQEMATMMGLKERATDRIIAQTYKHLGLITFYTCGPKEIHCWPIKKGMNIRKAAGEIHSDLERGFICAEVFNYDDLMVARSEAKLKEIGKLRTEGQDYIVKDGDTVHIKFNV
jgi:GTP-binding protein YchF